MDSTYKSIGHPEIVLGIDQGANFHIFDIRVHHHFFDDTQCSYRFELRFTVLGISLGFAWVRLYND